MFAANWKLMRRQIISLSFSPAASDPVPPPAVKFSVADRPNEGWASPRFLSFRDAPVADMLESG